MALDRRDVLRRGAALAGAGALLVAETAEAAGPKPRHENGPTRPSSSASHPAPSPEDGPAALQAAIDQAAAKGEPLRLKAGTYRTEALALRSGVVISGVPGRTVLIGDAGALVTADTLEDVTVRDLVLDGTDLPLNPEIATGLLTAVRCRNLRLEGLTVRNSLINGITLEGCSGLVTDCIIEHVGITGIFSRDADGLEITRCRVTGADNNGIQVWRSEPGMDGTIVSLNRIDGIAAKSGGSGEHGNGINIFRAGHVLVANNRITGCAYSAVRGNASADLQIIANSCSDIGEVALYAEFGFEGAVISANVVDGAASGISVTNFNDGGRLAVVQGNLIRNLRLRPDEPVDKRGDGISVEADAVVSGNVVENAPGIGIAAGWGRYLRDVVISGNLVRGAGMGIVVSVSEGAGSCLITQNIIKDVRVGAILGSDHGKPADLARNPGVVVASNITA